MSSSEHHIGARGKAMQSHGNGYATAVTAFVNILRFNTSRFYRAGNDVHTNRT
jgi:hypothetical protein